MTTSPMGLAKWRKFRAVVMMACDEGILPLDERVTDVADEAELDDIYETERRLLTSPARGRGSTCCFRGKLRSLST